MALTSSGRCARSRSRAGSRWRARQAGCVLAAVVVAASVGAAAGCTAKPASVDFPHPPSDTDARSRPEAAPTPTVDPEVAAAIDQVLDAYRGSVEASVTANRAGDPDHPHLDRYLTGSARAQVATTLRTSRDDNVYYAGELRMVSATVTEIDLAAQPPTATVEACLDSTDYRPVDRDTEAPVPGAAGGGKHMEKITVERFANGRWMVAAYHPVDQTC